MQRPSSCVLKAAASFSQKALSSAAPPSARLLCKATSEPASSSRPSHSRILRIQRAMVSLMSLQPLQAATSQASFVSRLSMGSQQPVVVLQGHFFSALTEL